MTSLTNNYGNLRRFATVAKEKSIENIQKFLDTMQHLRYEMYVISFLMNGLDGIKEINGTVDRRYYDKMSNSVSKHTLRTFDDLCDLAEMLQDEIDEEFGTLLKEHEAELAERYEISPEKAEDIDWDIVSHRRYYNEIENPSIIDFMLDVLFVRDEQPVRYLVSMYDFGGYEILFIDEESMNEFIENLVDCGTAFELGADGAWTELYSI